MSLGARVRIIAGTAHQLVVERSYIHKVPIYASLQIAPLGVSLQFTQFAISSCKLMELIIC